MAQLRELKGRIKAVGNIKRITKTMQMIATAKFQAASRRATQTKPYTQKVSEMVGELARAAGTDGQIEHPLLQTPDPATGRELLLIITSNRGLCGAYNANVLRTAAALLKQHSDTTFDLQIVGKKGLAFLRFNEYQIEQAHTDIGDEPTYAQVEALAREYIARFTAGRYDAVRVAYMQFISNARQMPQVMTLLPMTPPQADEQDSDGSRGEVMYEFSPEPAEILAELLPVTLKTQLFQAFNDAVVSEQVARMVAMKAATDNADQMGRNLRRQFNRARQAQITTELTEIVGGAAALE